MIHVIVFAFRQIMDDDKNLFPLLCCKQCNAKGFIDSYITGYGAILHRVYHKDDEFCLYCKNCIEEHNNDRFNIRNAIMSVWQNDNVDLPNECIAHICSYLVKPEWIPRHKCNLCFITHYHKTALDCPTLILKFIRGQYNKFESVVDRETYTRDSLRAEGLLLY